MRNLALPDNGGSIHDFTSQYHHESRCLNLMNRDATLVWFTDVAEPLPQHVTIKLQKPSYIKRVGIFIHGENNQNPRHLEIYLSQDAKEWTKVADSELEQKAGDYLFDVPKDKDGKMMVAQYVKFNITANYGGSGVHVSKVYVFGEMCS